MCAFYLQNYWLVDQVKAQTDQLDLDSTWVSWIEEFRSDLNPQYY